MDGPALSWLQWMYNNRQIASCKNMCIPYNWDSPHLNLKAKKAKLTQFELGSINHNLRYFPIEDTQTSSVICPITSLLFHPGHKAHIRREVHALQPITLKQATGLGKIEEDKSMDIKSFWNSSLLTNPFTTHELFNHSISTTKPPLLHKFLRSLPLKKLSSSEL